jgi:hypothetical protein
MSPEAYAPAEADGAETCTGDSAPLSRLARLSLCTHHSSARCTCRQVRALTAVSYSIVRHKPTTRAALEPNKPHRSGTGVTPVTSDAAPAPPPTRSPEPKVTRYIGIRNDQHDGSWHPGEIFIVAGYRPAAGRPGEKQQVLSVTNQRSRAAPPRFSAPGPIRAAGLAGPTDRGGAPLGRGARNSETAPGKAPPGRWGRVAGARTGWPAARRRGKSTIASHLHLGASNLRGHAWIETGPECT